MTKYYFWISYNKETKKYCISGSPCVDVIVNNQHHIYLLRDVDFSYVVNYDDNVKLYLVSYETNRLYIAYEKILKSFNELKDDNVKIEKIIEFKIPKSINEFLSNNEMNYDMSNYDKNGSHSKIRVSNNIFSVNLIYRRPNNKQSYLYLTHPSVMI